MMREKKRLPQIPIMEATISAMPWNLGSEPNDSVRKTGKYTTSLIKNEAKNIPHNTAMLSIDWVISALQNSFNALWKPMEFSLVGTVGFFNTNVRQTATSTITKLQMKVGTLYLLPLMEPTWKSTSLPKITIN